MQNWLDLQPADHWGDPDFLRWLTENFARIDGFMRRMQNRVYGFAITAGVDANHDVLVQPGVALTVGGVPVVSQEAVLTALDGVHLDTGVLAADTTYYLWLLLDPNRSREKLLWSTSITLAGVTKPTGYIDGQVLHALCTNSSANLYPWEMTGNEVAFSSGAGPNVTDTVLADITWEEAYIGPGHSRVVASGYWAVGSGVDTFLQFNVRTKGRTSVSSSAVDAMLWINPTNVLMAMGRQFTVVTDVDGNVEYAVNFTTTPGTMDFRLRSIAYEFLHAGRAV